MYGMYNFGNLTGDPSSQEAANAEASEHYKRPAFGCHFPQLVLLPQNLNQQPCAAIERRAQAPVVCEKSRPMADVQDTCANGS